MKPQRKISIIICFYNVGKILNKSIGSIINQSFNDWDLILVNDGSTDDSIFHAENLASRDKRITIINKKVNEKLSKARQTGLQAAQSEYICFLDADDWLDKNALFNLYSDAIKNNSDIVIGGYVNVYGNRGWFKSKPINLIPDLLIKKNYYFDEIEKKFSCAFYGIHSIPVMACGKLYKRELFKEYLQENIVSINSFEDTYLNASIFQNVNQISFIKDAVYFYKYGGMTSRVSPNVPAEITALHNKRLELFSKTVNYDRKLESASIEYLNTIHQYFYNCMAKNFLNKSTFIDEINRVNTIINFDELKNFFIKHNIAWNKEFYKAYFSNDFNKVYLLMKNEIDKNKVKLRLKKVISQFITYI